MKNIHKTYLSLLKKVKIFDLVIAGIIITVGLGLFFLFYRRVEYIQIRVRVSEREVLYLKSLPKNWYAQRFITGDYELDALGRKISEVVEVERFAVDNEKDVVFLEMLVRATYDTRTKTYSTRGKTIMFGSPMRFNLQGVTFDGIVTEFPGSTEKMNIVEKYVTVKTLGRYVEPYIVNALSPGRVVTNSNGSILAEIEKVEVKPAEKVTTTDQGDLLLRNDPLYKDLYLTLKIKVKVINGETVMFDSLPVKIDQVIPLNFAEISIFPVITSVQE